MDKQESKRKFTEWFDSDDVDHLHAYHILQETGMWPEDFIPENVCMEIGWQHALACKLADKWIDYKISHEKVERGCANRKCKYWNPEYDHNDNCTQYGMRYNGNLCKDYI